MPNSPLFCFISYFDRWLARCACVCGQAWPRVLPKRYFRPRQIACDPLEMFKISLSRVQTLDISLSFFPCLYISGIVGCDLPSSYGTHLSNCIIILFLHFNCISNDKSQHFSFGCLVANGAICKMEIERKKWIDQTWCGITWQMPYILPSPPRISCPVSSKIRRQFRIFFLSISEKIECAYERFLHEPRNLHFFQDIRCNGKERTTKISRWTKYANW